MKHDLCKRFTRAAILTVSIAFAATLTACTEREDSWPDTAEVSWDARTQTCYLHGDTVSFDEPSTYESCLELAYASVDGTLIVPDTSDGLDLPKAEDECCVYICVSVGEAMACRRISCEPC